MQHVSKFHRNSFNGNRVITKTKTTILGALGRRASLGAGALRRSAPEGAHSLGVGAGARRLLPSSTIEVKQNNLILTLFSSSPRQSKIPLQETTAPQDLGMYGNEEKILGFSCFLVLGRPSLLSITVTATQECSLHARLLHRGFSSEA